MSDDWNNATPADFAKARRERASLTDPTKVDRLPPHSIEAEQGVLGCILVVQEPLAVIAQCRKRLMSPAGEEFYDLRHREIWLTLGAMYDDLLAGRPLCASETAGDGIDLITVKQRLTDNGKLADVGGVSYLASLPDATPSAANVEFYLEILAEKFALRKGIACCTEFIGRAQDHLGPLDPLFRTLQDDVGTLSRLASPPEEAHKMYLKPSALGDEFFHRWFGRMKGVHGRPLPELAFGNFPFLIRERELTLVEAETKMGKSTMLSYITLHLLNQGMRFVIDSREVHYVDTMKKLVMQLTGLGEGKLCLVGDAQAKDKGHLDCTCSICATSLKLWSRAMVWLEQRVMVNKTTGIKHWRDVLDAFYELAKEGYTGFSLDSLMRIGIADDDFTQQAQCVTAFANFSIETNSVMFLVNHRNKGDGDYRQKSGGSYKVAANAHNICSVWKNGKKYDDLAPGFDKLKGDPSYTYDDFKFQYAKQLAQPDAKFYVHDQRLDQARSNAARELWFLKRGGQYFDHRHPRPTEPVNWLERWTRKGGKEA